MTETKKTYLEPKVECFDFNAVDVITTSSASEYLTNGRYDEENLWGGFTGWTFEN